MKNGEREAGASSPPLPIDRGRSYSRAVRSAKRMARAHLRPPPQLTVSEWADQFRRLSSVASAEPGPWRTDRAPYQREILDSVSDPEVEEVVVMSSAQVGKTEIINNAVGFFIDLDPAPILVVQPTLEMAEAWSKDRLSPMLAESPSLARKIPPTKTRSSDNTIRHKAFPGGHITVSGANSPASLASRPIRVVVQDEIDRFPASAGSEGDPCFLADKRTNTFWNRVKLKVSTPTVKGLSRIAKAYDESDQRQFYVPCPHCGHYQTLRWANVRWENSDPETAVFVCSDRESEEEGAPDRGCGAVIEEGDKADMLAAGEWRARYPKRRIRGYHLNSLYSPWRRWSEVVAEFLRSKDVPELLQVFVNTELGETWEEGGERLDADALIARPRWSSEAQVPMGVGMLTAGVDVQGDRLELLVLGWGAGQQQWTIAHDRILGDPAKDEVWRDLDALLFARYRHESGVDLRISAACIDSGGHHTEQVYRFVRPRQRRRIYAIKGMDGEGRPLVSRPKRIRGTRKVTPLTVGTVTAKDLIYSRLQIRQPGPGYIAFGEDLDEEFFQQLTAERAITKWSHGRPRRAYVKDPSLRNEALDLFVYAYAALGMVGRAAHERLERWVAQVAERARRAKQRDQEKEAGEPAEQEAPAEELEEDLEEALGPDPPKTKRKARRRRRGKTWVRDW